MSGWIGIDLDGTIAEYHGWNGDTTQVNIGAPIPAMIERVKKFLAAGYKVKIFTARVCDCGDHNTIAAQREAIERWCEAHVGQRLEVTNVKDYAMIVLYDDRCVRVEMNTGRVMHNPDFGVSIWE